MKSRKWCRSYFIIFCYKQKVGQRVCDDSKDGTYGDDEFKLAPSMTPVHCVGRAHHKYFPGVAFVVSVSRHSPRQNVACRGVETHENTLVLPN